MRTASRVIVVILILLSTCTIANSSDALSAHNSEQEVSKAAINPITSGGFVRNWLMVGPFPNPETEQLLPDGTNFIGYGKDYLQCLGGEAKAVLSPETSVSFKDEAGKENTVKTCSIEAGANNIVDFYAHFRANYKIAYAFCYLQSEKAETRYCFFGSDDDAKVWVNGELVNNVYAGRSCVAGQDNFEIKLNKGLNPVLVKVCNRTGDWGMVLEVCNAERLALIKAEKLKKEKLRAFQNCRLRPQGWPPYMFEEGKFPEIQWEQPFIVEDLMGKFPLKVRWFDNALNEVTIAEKPGRYMAVVEGITPEGIKIRRALTLYCRDKKFCPLTYYKNKSCLDYISGGAIDKKAWEERSNFIASDVGRLFLEWMETEEKGAVMMTYLAEMKPLGRKVLKTETPEILNDDYQLALKRKVLGVEDKWPKLKMPAKIKSKQAPVLQAGTPEKASVKKDTAEKIRSVCKQWYKASKEPFAILVARRGVIIIHEAFGETPTGPITVDKPMEMASITKLMTGMMFAQFIDQGLINIDDPVGKYLPDFPVEGDKVVTLRHCFTHTTGLEGHYEWGGMHNPWFDNVVANGLQYLSPGKIHIYNGVGYDLAGKVMEMVSGKSIFRLMHENFFEPLGVNNTTIDDLACATTCSVEDIARIGQLIVNKGSYGNLQFFSEDTFNKLTPQKLSKFYPDIPVEWGIGLTPMLQPNPKAGKGSVPKDATILSKNVIGHGAASSAILRVDLDNDLVIAQTRNTAGQNYNEYLTKFLIAIEDGLIK
jgi:CubicO group peptidase (beta-lactamase class C family)